MTQHLALISQTRSLIMAGDISAAEAALSGLADTEGDGALMVVLEQLQPKDILAVIREYDAGKESIVNLLVTPEQFARAVVMERLYADPTHTHLRGMINSIVFREQADPVAFLTALGEADGGNEALADYFSDKWTRLEAFTRTGRFEAVDDDGQLLDLAELLALVEEPPQVDQDEVADQDWMELAWILRCRCPELFMEVLAVLRNQVREHAQAAMAAATASAEAEAEAGDEPDVGRTTQVVRHDSDEESAI